MDGRSASRSLRRGWCHDWTNPFNKAAHDAWRINASSAVVDGEIVVPAADGTTDFSVLQNELRGSSVPNLEKTSEQLTMPIDGLINVGFHASCGHSTDYGLRPLVTPMRTSCADPLTGSHWDNEACRSRDRVIKPAARRRIDQKITRLRLSRVSVSPQPYPHRMPA